MKYGAVRKFSPNRRPPRTTDPWRNAEFSAALQMITIPHHIFVILIKENIVFSAFSWLQNAGPAPSHGHFFSFSVDLVAVGRGGLDETPADQKKK